MKKAKVKKPASTTASPARGDGEEEEKKLVIALKEDKVCQILCVNFAELVWQ